ncbi:MAG: hypothetical protein ACOC0P_07695 [Planctomycetota bacterium]
MILMSGIAAATLCLAGVDHQVAHRVEVTPEGAKVVRDIRTDQGVISVDTSAGLASVTTPRWVEDDAGLLWISRSVAIGDSGASILAGKGLNNESVTAYPASIDQQIFDFSTFGSEDPIVDVADRAARGVAYVAFDRDTGSGFDFEGLVYAFDLCGNGTPLWEYVFPRTQNFFGGGAAISDDGNVVLAWKADPITEELLIEAFDWAGNSISSGTLSAISGGNPQFNSRQSRLSDDGSRAYFFIGTDAIVYDVSSATEIFRFNIGASFDSHDLSGDGSTFAFGNFGRWEAWSETSPGNWTQVATQSFGGSTFVGQVALNQDGSRLAYINQTFSPAYDQFEVGMYDISTGTPLFSDVLSAPGTGFQLNGSGIDVDEAGEYMVGGSWGDEFNTTPEVFGYDAAGNQTVAIDARGSAFSVDLDADGDAGVSGHKAVHANTFGNGGDVIAFDAYEQTLSVVGYPQQGGSVDLEVPAVGDRIIISVTNDLGASFTPYGVAELDVTTELTRLGPITIPATGLILPASIPAIPLLSCNDVHLQGVIFDGSTGTLTNKVSVRVLP